MDWACSRKSYKNCIPFNYDALARDLKLYHAFFYLEDILIEEVRCLDYGVSVRYTSGTRLKEENIKKQYFENHYKGYFTRDCENWSFSPYTT